MNFAAFHCKDRTKNVIEMDRLINKTLITWKNNPEKKPLLLKGVRQCGKTWVLKKFGEDYYEDVLYINFEGNHPLQEIFSQDLNPERILTELSLLRGKPILTTTLLIFDEIQFCPNAITSLKYFYEEIPQQHIVCAGSLLGVALAKPLSFPVGKVTVLTMYPMNFSEFLLANNEELLLDHLSKLRCYDKIPESIFLKLKTLYRDYLITGGMPEVVKTWLSTHDTQKVEETLQQILKGYELDFAKYAPIKDVPKLSLIWNSISEQLAKENGKFIFGHVKSGARSRDLEDALQWLIDAGLVYKIERVERPNIPVSAYADPSFFKIYLADVGLLRSMSRFPIEALSSDLPLTSHMKGALTENFVLTEMVFALGNEVYFWRSGNIAELDFVLQYGMEVVPIEVKASENLRSKSLMRYRELYHPKVSVRVSQSNLNLLVLDEEVVFDLPLMLVWRIGTYFDELIENS